MNPYERTDFICVLLNNSKAALDFENFIVAHAHKIVTFKVQPPT